MHRRTAASLALVIMAMLLPPDLAALECRDYQDVMQAAGDHEHDLYAPRDLAVRNDVAYVIGRYSAKVEVIDISDPGAMATVDTLALPAIPTSVAAGDAGLFVTVPGHGLFRFDLTDPAAPTLVDSLDLGVDLLDVALGNGVAYVAMGDAGAHAIALDLPGGLVALDVVTVPSSVENVAYDDGWLYLATFVDGLIVVEASDPTNLLYAGVAEFPARGQWIAAGHGIVAVAGTAFSNGAWQVRAYDVAMPWQPQTLGTVEEAGGGSPRPVIASSSRLFVATAGNGLYQFDLVGSDLVRTGFRQGSQAAMVLESDRYVSATHDVIEVSSPGVLPPTALSDIYAASSRPTLRDGLLYASHHNILYIVDATDPANPAYICSQSIPDGPDVRAIALLGDTLYLTGDGAFLDIYDIGDPTAPVLVDHTFLARPPFYMVVDGGYLYVAQDGSGLRVLDLADPRQPVVIGAAPFDIGEARAIAKLGDQVLIAGRDHGVDVFDVSDPTHPTVAGWIPGSLVLGLAVADDRLLIAYDQDPLETWTRAPGSGAWIKLGESEPLNGAGHLAVSGTVCYASDYDGDFVVLDLGGGGVPTQLSTWDPLELVSAIVANETMVATVSWYDYDFIPPQCPLVPTSAPEVAPAAAVRLAAPAPNPFNPRTRIRFELPAASRATLRVYDLRGRYIRTLLDKALDRGDHAVDWNGRDDAGRSVPSGIYHARLETRTAAISRKLTLLK